MDIQKNNLIFVVGASRSGTTLIGQILNQSPDIFTPGESHFFEDIWSHRNKLGALVDTTSMQHAVKYLMTLYGRYNFPNTQQLVEAFIDPIILSERALESGGGYAGLYRAFMTNLAEIHGKSKTCDDTPKHLFYLPTIFDLFADAKVIACVRDPRDFLCSYKNYWRRSAESKRVKMLYHPIITSLLWRSVNNALATHIEKYSSEQLIVLNYESLVSMPEAEVHRICRFLNVEYSPDLLAVPAQNSSFLSDKEETSGIFNTSIGRWQQELDSYEVWWLQKITSTTMRQFGYKPVLVQPSWLQVAWSLVKAPLCLLFGLRANYQKRGPLISYLWRRLIPILNR